MDWNKQSHLYVPLVAVEDLLSKKKKRCQNITHIYHEGGACSFFPILHSQKSNPEPPTMTHYSLGGLERREKKCRLACFGCFTDRAVSHAAPEWQSCPISLDSCWLQLGMCLSVFVRHLLVFTLGRIRLRVCMLGHWPACPGCGSLLTSFCILCLLQSSIL